MNNQPIPYGLEHRRATQLPGETLQHLQRLLDEPVPDALRNAHWLRSVVPVVMPARHIPNARLRIEWHAHEIALYAQAQNLGLPKHTAIAVLQALANGMPPTRASVHDVFRTARFALRFIATTKDATPTSALTYLTPGLRTAPGFRLDRSMATAWLRWRLAAADRAAADPGHA